MRRVDNAADASWSPLAQFASVGGGLAGGIAVSLAMTWLQIFVHEIAHVLAFLLVGGRASSLEVGRGRFVWAMQWFGMRVELRPIWSHGLVRGVVLGARAYRWRWTIVWLAGPIASTAVLAAVAWSASTWMGPLQAQCDAQEEVAAALACVGALWACGVGAVVAWLPLRLRIGRLCHESDVLAIWSMWHMTKAAVAMHRQSTEAWMAAQAAFESFIAGMPRRARRSSPSASAWAICWTRSNVGPRTLACSRSSLSRRSLGCCSSRGIGERGLRPAG